MGSDVTVGALLSLTGHWSTLGIASKAVLEIAAAEINTFFEATHSPGRVVLRVEDTRLEPERAVLPLLANTGAIRTSGSFEFWGLTKAANAAKWTSLATYDGGVYRATSLGSAA